MSTAKKSTLSDAKAVAVAIARGIVTPVTPTAGLPPGVRIETNAKAVARFPLPLTVGSAIVGAIGAIAFMRGYRVAGGLISIVGVAGIGAAALAPEINGFLDKTQGIAPSNTNLNNVIGV